MKIRQYIAICSISIFLLIAGCAEFNSESGGDATKASSDVVPTAVIDSISPSVTTCHVEVIFTGHGEDDYGTITGHLWVSSLDGELSNDASFPSTSLSEGIHVISFTVFDNNGLASEPVSQTLTITPSANIPPTATIISIMPADPLAGENVIFWGQGSDIDGKVTGYKWASSIDGDLSTLPSFSTTSLSEGSHTIRFTVYDNDFAASNPAINNLTLGPAPNITPDAQIISVDPSASASGEEITLFGQGADKDGMVTGYLWESSLDGDLSTLPSFSTASLSEGSHDIFFVAYDNEGATSIPAYHRVQVGPERVFPEEDWVRAEPADLEALGLDPDIVSTTTDINDFGNIAYYMKQDQANGVLICNGYLIGDWNYAGHPDLQKDVQSCTKSIVGLVLGLAIDDGIVPGLDFRVKDSYPGFQSVNGFEDQITFRHLVTHTSGMETTGKWPDQYDEPVYTEPGTAFNYHNNHFLALSTALTYLYDKELDLVIREKVLSIINADMGHWNTDAKIETIQGKLVNVNTGFAYSRWSATDLARVGYLFLNKGRWKDRQVISEEYIEKTFTEIPFQIGAADEIGYGLAWWHYGGVNVWSMIGHGGQFCLVLPDYNIVMTKINHYNVKPSANVHKFYSLIMACLTTDND